MAQESEPTILIKPTEDGKSNEDLGVFFLSDRFADVRFVVEGQKLYAHKVILAFRSSYFESLLSNASQNEFSFDNINVQSFKDILKYIYSGSVSVAKDLSAMFELLKLAHKYSLASLESILTKNISSFLSPENVCLTLNRATLNGLQELLGVCVRFIDDNINQILENETFFALTEPSIVEVIKRDAFPFPEIEIFKIVEKWCRVNRNQDNTIVECVRLPLLTIDEILKVVRPSKLVDAGTLMDAIECINNDPFGQTQRRTRACSPNSGLNQIEVELPSARDVQRTLHILELPDEQSLLSLDRQAVEQIKSKINLENVSSVLNTANSHDLVHLQEACLSLIDKNVFEFMEQDFFHNLTKASLVELIRRDTFGAPERQIFEAVAKWCTINNDTDESLINCIRFSLMTFEDIVSTVWSSGLVKNETLREAIDQIVGAKEMSATLRTCLVVDVNVATSTPGAEILHGNNSSWLLYASDDSNVCAEGSSITVKLKRPYFINNIKMRLGGRDGSCKCSNFGSFSYSIEVSLDCKNWKRIITYDPYKCWSLQNLYFDVEAVRYIKVNKPGVSSTLELVNFEAYFRNTVQTTVNGIIRPKCDVSMVENLQGNFREHVLMRMLRSEKVIVVQLAQPYLLSYLKFYLTIDGRYDYTVETSIDVINWKPAISRQNAIAWQENRFLERPVVFIQIKFTIDLPLSLEGSRFVCH